MNFIGIDPGKSGAIALITTNDFFVIDLPVDPIKYNKYTYYKPDASLIKRFIRNYCDSQDYLSVIESPLVGSPLNAATQGLLNRQFGFLCGFMDQYGLVITLDQSQWKGMALPKTYHELNSKLILTLQNLNLWDLDKFKLPKGDKPKTDRMTAVILAWIGSRLFNKSSTTEFQNV